MNMIMFLISNELNVFIYNQSTNLMWILSIGIGSKKHQQKKFSSSTNVFVSLKDTKTFGDDPGQKE